MVEIIGFRNYAFHEPIPGHQLNILWQRLPNVGIDMMSWTNDVSLNLKIIWRFEDGFRADVLYCNSPQDWAEPRWRHQMETFSALLAICAGNSPVPGEFTAQRPVTRSFDVSLICARINCWVNNGDAGDLRRYRAHYDVTVMDITLRLDIYPHKIYFYIITK